MLEKVNDEHILYLALVQIHLQKSGLYFKARGKRVHCLSDTTAAYVSLST